MSSEDNQGEKVPGREDVTEEYSFDELAIGLASGSISRGRALKLVGGAVLGSLLGGLLLPGEAQAARRRRRRVAGPVCPTGTTFCGGGCVSCAGGRLNPFTCQCQCPANTTLCGGRCVQSCTARGQHLNPNTCLCECEQGSSVCGNQCCQSGTTCCQGPSGLSTCCNIRPDLINVDLCAIGICAQVGAL